MTIPNLYHIWYESITLSTPVFKFTHLNSSNEGVTSHTQWQDMTMTNMEMNYGQRMIWTYDGANWGFKNLK